MRHGLTRAGKARVRLAQRHAFFASIAFKLDIIETEDRETNIRTIATDGRRIVINSQWSEDPATDIDSVVAELGAAALSVGLAHPARMGDRDPKAWNEACARARAPIMAQAFPTEARHNQSPYYNIQDELTAEQWYREPEQGDGSCDNPGNADGSGQGQGQGEGEGNGQSQGKGQGESGNGYSTACEVLQMPSGANADAEKSRGKSEMASASVAEQAQRGTLPAWLKQYLETIRAPRLSPRELLREYMLSTCNQDSSWARPSRRWLAYQMILPSRRTPSLGTVAIALDTSASVPEDKVRLGLGWAEAIMEEVPPDEVHILQCDAAVTSYEVLDRYERPSREITGRGGTAFTPIFEELANRGVVPDVLMIVTDMMGDIPDDPGFPVIWMHTMDRAPKHMRQELLDRIPFGAKIPLE